MARMNADGSIEEGKDGQLQPKTEPSIGLKRTEPEQGRGFVVTALSSANIREIRGKDRFCGWSEWIVGISIYQLPKVDFFR